MLRPTAPAPSSPSISRCGASPYPDSMSTEIGTSTAPVIWATRCVKSSNDMPSPSSLPIESATG
jgi:hypothetical protein